MAKASIGTSGFQYSHWRGTFYPEGLAQRKWLLYYAERFNTVELNVTFYRLPKRETFLKWRDETPDDFRISLKGSRYITHVKRLKDPAEPLERFMDLALELRDKLSVVLWQFPPNFRKNGERLQGFLEALSKYSVRSTFEFRDDSWLDPEVLKLMKQGGHCLCMADWPPFLDDLPATSDFVYIRRHGHEGSYATCYSKKELRRDADRILRHLKGRRDVFIYFNNDAFGYAPKNALELKELLGR